MTPKMKLFVGPMFSGKSTRLVQNINRARIAGKNVICFKPIFDNRYTSEGYIVTHDKVHESCFLVSKSSQFLKIFEEEDKKMKIDCVAIDEAFMIDGIADACCDLFYNRKVDIFISSLDLSFSLTSFEEITKLLTHATHVKKCKAVCPNCGSDASYTMRKESGNNNQITIGGKDMYEPRCLAHHANLNDL
jgi:thymidine kinase